MIEKERRKPRKTTPKLTEGYEVIAVPFAVKERLDCLKRDKEAYYEVIVRLIIFWEQQYHE
jgi:hypothetical protein